MAADPVRIEIRGLAAEREEAGRDLRETLEALGERLQPSRAAHRFLVEHDPRLVVAGVLSIGLAIGLARDSRPAGRVVGLLSAAVAGWTVARIVR